MTRYVLDASFLIDHLRGDRGATDRFNALNEGGDELVVCGVSAGEAWSGRPNERERSTDCCVTWSSSSRERHRVDSQASGAPRLASAGGPWP